MSAWKPFDDDYKERMEAMSERERQQYTLYDYRMKIFTVACCIAGVPIGWAFSFFIVMHALAVK